MSTAWDIRYSKTHIARGQEKGTGVFAIGYITPAGSRAEVFMYLQDEKATTLWVMAHEMNANGKTAEEALKIAQERIAENKAKIAARLAAKEAEKEASGVTDGAASPVPA